MMRRLRKALLHLSVWLTAAGTLVAGVPHLQCRCPGGLVQPVDSPSCCCCVAAAEAEDAPPSCCQKPPASKDQATGPTFRHDECQKALVLPPDATVQRAEVEFQQLSVELGVVMDRTTNEVGAPIDSVHVDMPPLPPPIDLHLVLQHFVI